jgi:hypothetical protein
VKSNSRKLLEKKLDVTWSKVVRHTALDRCEYCGSTNTVQAHHIIPRTHKGTRWDVHNGVSLCLAHHLYWAHKDVIAFYEWIATKRNLDRLKVKGYSVSKWQESELKLLLNELESMI